MIVQIEKLLILFICTYYELNASNFIDFLKKNIYFIEERMPYHFLCISNDSNRSLSFPINKVNNVINLKIPWKPKLKQKADIKLHH